MKITGINTYIVEAERHFLFVVVETDSGIRGLGEGGITWRESATAGYIDALSPLLIGEDPFRTEHLWQVMFRSGFFPAGRVGCAAISALDIALWDIKAKALGVPLYQLLGGRVRDRVACYPHIRGNTPAELAEAAGVRASEGWKFVRTEIRPEADGVRFEPGRAVRRCLDDFAAIREAIGDDVELLVDVHTRLDPPDAISFCRQVEQFRPFFVEDPIRMENFDSFRKLARHVSVPLAIGEQYATKWEFRQQIEEDLLDYARIDLCIVGGLTEALKIAGWCETHYIKLALHNPLGPVSTAACLHLDLASSLCAVQELARIPGTYMQDVFPVQAPYAAGHLQVPTAPGLGIEFDERAALLHPPTAHGGCPQYRRDDGSFTNW